MIIMFLLFIQTLLKTSIMNYLELNVSITKTIPEADEIRRSHVHNEGVCLLNGSVEGTIGDLHLGLHHITVVQMEVVTLIGGGKLHVYPRLDHLEVRGHVSGR